MNVTLISCPECGQHGIFAIEMGHSKKRGRELITHSAEFASRFVGRAILRRLTLTFNVSRDAYTVLLAGVNGMDKLPERLVIEVEGEDGVGSEEVEVGTICSAFCAELMLDDGISPKVVAAVLCIQQSLSPQQAAIVIAVARAQLSNERIPSNDNPVCHFAMSLLTEEECEAMELEDAAAASESYSDTDDVVDTESASPDVLSGSSNESALVQGPPATTSSSGTPTGSRPAHGGLYMHLYGNLGLLVD